MLVVFLVAVEAVQRGLAVALQIFMTRCAFDFCFCMGVTQNKLCLVMRETPGGGFPISLTMTLRTLVAQGGVVLVVFLVTANTLFGCLFKQGTLVAFFALYLAVFAQQREAALVMVKFGRLFPTAFAMATDAIPPQCVFVFVVLGMAGITVLTQFSPVKWLFVTCGTRGRLMFAAQRIFGIHVMVE